MTARTSGRAGRAAAGALFLALLSAPRALLAQDDPTPFWLAEPPAKDSPAQATKKKSKPAKPAPAPRAGDETAAPAPKKAAPSRPAPEAAPKRKKAPQADDDVPELPPQKKKSRYEPLPPLPHLEPGDLGSAPAPQPQAQPARPVYPAQPRSPQPSPQAARPAQGAPAVVPLDERGAPDAPGARVPQAPPVYPQPAPASPPPAYTNPRVPVVPAPQPGGQTVVPLDERGDPNSPSARAARAASLAPPAEAPSQGGDDQPAAPRLRRFSLEALGGVWDKATSDGTSRDWQVAYGLDVGFAAFRWLQLDVRAVRSSGTDGNPYVNATTSHTLFDGRLLGVATFGKLAAFAGGGGGLVLEKTQLFLQDVNSQPTTLSSSGLEGVGEVVLGVRVRPWRGLTVRLEADGILRQGNDELLLLLGAGWAF